MQKIYPLKFEPIYKEKLWGGQKVREQLGLDFSPLPNCGEVWAVSAVEGNLSVVAEGSLKGQDIKSLISTYQDKLVGKKVFEQYGTQLPLLIKFLDANQDLSIQVHPDDRLAKARHGDGAYGKTEMWYIMQADEGASLITGFNQEMDQKKYLEHFNAGQLERILNREEAKKDDVFFIPAGRVHTIGQGLMLAEIQQTSDITYRIYDFDRKDAEGNLRELHTEAALDAIDYKKYDSYKTHYQHQADQVNALVSCPYFTTNRLDLTKEMERNHSAVDSFIVYIALEGAVEVEDEGEKTYLKKGEAIMVPATATSIQLRPESEAKLLETYIP